ncbi:MAG: ABC1 kinase family protein [Thermoplasmatota archaeon]
MKPAGATEVPSSRMGRFNEILAILLRNDAWGLLRAMTAPAPAALVEGEVGAPESTRRVLEELGPTFIKIGQLLATRPDLVSPEYVTEFRKLYDKTTPSPDDEVRQVLREEWGRDLGEVLSEFDSEAIASASIGQVHRGRLLDGTLVAVKVQHAGIADAMALDFEILSGLVAFVERTFAATRVWQPASHLEELRAMLEAELDYRYEMRNTEQVGSNFRNDPQVRIPRIFAHLCGRRVLVMEFVEGTRYTQRDDPALAGIDLPAVARTITLAMARQIFMHRLFHADPSPGNILIVGKVGGVAFLDFGAVGVVTERRARAILKLITALAKGQVEETAEAILDLCEQRGEYNPKRFTNDVERILDYFEREGVSVADPRIMERILRLARDHRMLLPPDFVLITRALYQFEGVARDMDPAYDLVQVLDPFAAQMAWHDLASPEKQKEMAQETVGELLRFARTFPTALNRLMRKVERNELSTRVEIVGLEEVMRSHGRGILKTSFTLLMGALVVGLGIVYAGGSSARVGGFLFASAVIVALWTMVMLLWSEAMKGKRD